MSSSAVLLSIKPKYVAMIEDSTKKYELRRKCPKVVEGDLALVYESSPTMSLVGAFMIGGIIQKAPTTLWKEVGGKSGVSRREFLEYFDGCKIASAIIISQYWSLNERVSLSKLRSLTNIEPPQSFRYLCHEKTSQLLSGEYESKGISAF